MLFPKRAPTLSSMMLLHITTRLREFLGVSNNTLTNTKSCLVFQVKTLRRSAVKLSTTYACKAELLKKMDKVL
jgi:hypothetical protein